MSAILVPNELPPQMVRRGGTYYDEDEPAFRRFSTRGHPYPISHDRELSSAQGHPYPRSQHLGSQDSRNGDHSSETEEVPRTRSRIPVACGRCRKRKIRCSGDNGGPCTNCKQAGNDQCAFLRVSSTEAQMKNETPAFDFDSGAGSRLNCRMVPFGPHSYASQSSLTFDQYPYRNNTLSAYQYGGVKNFYSMPTYDLADEYVENGLHQQYQLLSGDNLGLTNSYVAPPTPSRSWGSTPQLHKSLPGPFLDIPTSNYAHGQLPYNGSNYDLRSNINPEPKSLPMVGGNSSLPAPPLSAGTDRLLPYPATNLSVGRPPQGNQYLPPADSLLLPGTQSRGPGSYIDYNTGQTVKSHNDSAVSVSENGSMPTPTYLPLPLPLPLSSNNPESLNSTQQNNYTTPSFSLLSSQPDVYTPPHSNDGHGLYHTTESSDSAYSHSHSNSQSQNDNSVSVSNSNPDSKRGSQSSRGQGQGAGAGGGMGGGGQGTSHDGLPPLAGGTLANGHKYIPPVSYPQQYYPAPPVEIQIQPQPRRQSGVLA